MGYRRRDLKKSIKCGGIPKKLEEVVKRRQWEIRERKSCQKI